MIEHDAVDATADEAVGNAYQLANPLVTAAYQALALGCEHDAKLFVDRALPITHDLGHPAMQRHFEPAGASLPERPAQTMAARSEQRTAATIVPSVSSSGAGQMLPAASRGATLTEAPLNK